MWSRSIKINKDNPLREKYPNTGKYEHKRKLGIWTFFTQ